MTALLFPGRHHVLTRFQEQCLRAIVAGEAWAMVDVDGRAVTPAAAGGPGGVDVIVWAVTSANHSGTRRNPLPAHRREAAIEALAAGLGVPSLVYLIDDIGETERFAAYVLKKIEAESGGRLRLTPENCLIGCSTPPVIAMYRALGFRVLPFELESRLGERERYRAVRPWECVEAIAAAAREGRDWRQDPVCRENVHPASISLLERYGYAELIGQLHADPLLSEDGDLTETRDYNTYVRSFDEGAERKYALIRDFLQPGRIVDIGCCTGSLVRQMTLDDSLRESDFYGIEIARPLYEECVHRKQQGHFRNDNVFFSHRNAVAEPVFPERSVDVFTTVSLTHEVESYQGREALRRFVRLLHGQLREGGRWINLDVVGPEDGDRLVRLELNAADGIDDDGRDLKEMGREEQSAYLAELSTLGRFRRFVREFRRDEGEGVEHEWVAGVRGAESGAWPAVTLRLRDACEFLSKKDYTDNWLSEMHERFCFFSFADWWRELEEAGFAVEQGSRAFVNDWIVQNRFEGRVRLRDAADGGQLPWPVTNAVLVAVKQLACQREVTHALPTLTHAGEPGSTMPVTSRTNE